VVVDLLGFGRIYFFVAAVVQGHQFPVGWAVGWSLPLVGFLVPWVSQCEHLSYERQKKERLRARYPVIFIANHRQTSCHLCHMIKQFPGSAHTLEEGTTQRVNIRQWYHGVCLHICLLQLYIANFGAGNVDHCICQISGMILEPSACTLVCLVCHNKILKMWVVYKPQKFVSLGSGAWEVQDIGRSSA
jgi:hypothetical protein